MIQRLLKFDEERKYRRYFFSQRDDACLKSLTGFLKGTAFKKGVFLRDVFDPDYTEFHVWEINHRAVFSLNAPLFRRIG